MRRPSAPSRGRFLRKLVVSVTAMVQFAGCARVRPVSVPVSETIPAAAPSKQLPTSASPGVTAADPAGPPASTAAARPIANRPKPRKPLTRKAKFKRALRRGAIKTEDGAKEALKVAGRVGVVALVAGAFAGLLYLDLLDGDIDLGDDDGDED